VLVLIDKSKRHKHRSLDIPGLDLIIGTQGGIEVQAQIRKERAVPLPARMTVIFFKKKTNKDCDFIF
jgi:hypothetical protein